MEEHLLVEEAPTVVGNISKVAQRFDIEGFSRRIGGSSAHIVEGVIYFGIGFIIGALSRRYFKFFFMLGLTTFLALKWFEYNNVITVDWAALYGLIGLESGHEPQYYIQLFFTTIKQNMVSVALLTLGFLFGNKLT